MSETTTEGSGFQSTLEEVRALLGLRDAGAVAELKLDDLNRLTHKQLLTTSRKLGLAGVSKLNKGSLAERLLEALRATAASGSPVMEEAEAMRTRKFELRGAAEESFGDRADIPWGYGQDRVTAMPVDPDRLFAYWEVTDDAIERARKALGSGAGDAWLNLRVYDTTGRLFDGTNAHSYFDHGVGRSDRQWFFHIGKPSSQAFVEIGVKSREGYFVRIARSPRIDFPRREMAPESEPEWLTVTVGGEVHHAGRGAPSRSWAGNHGGYPSIEGAGGGGGGGEGHGATLMGPATWTALRFPWQELERFGEYWFEERVEWEDFYTFGYFEGFRSWSWEEGPHTITTWEAGPFSYPVEVPPPSREELPGKVHVWKWGQKTGIVYGPWEVVIKGIHGRSAKRTLARWQLHRSYMLGRWREVKGEMRIEHGFGPAGSSGKIAGGASERMGLAASEHRLGGSSEVWYLGASELRLQGSSERLFAGASEYTAKGASERMYIAASETRLGGASETRLGGSSEMSFKGASEGRLGGASERHMGGASERRIGGSSETLGGSEGRLAAPPAPVPSNGNGSLYPKPPTDEAKGGR